MSSRFTWFFFFSLLLSFQQTFAGETLRKIEKELQALSDSTKQSVVSVTALFSHEISVEQTDSGILSFFKNEIEKRPHSYTNIGTGVVFDADGHVITRSSVVLGAEIIYVTSSDGRRLEAEFVGRDPQTGFSVLKVNDLNLRPVKLASSDNVLPGSLNLIIGNSLGVYPSIAFGAVNGIRDDGMLQISANLTPGNNGSPIINLEGEVIGLLAGQLNADVQGTRVSASTYLNSITVAYPANWVDRIAFDVIHFGYLRKGWLGVVGYHDGRRPEIRKIRANSPAQRAGLVEGDIIVRFSNKFINSIDDLARIVEFTAPGQRVLLEYIRGTSAIQTSVEVGEKKQAQKQGESQDHADNQSRDIPGYQSTVETETYKTGYGENLFLEKRIDQLEKELLLLRKLMKKEEK